MSGRFLICGLPRSRTAWFSVAATTPKSICFHEPTSGLQSFEDLKEFWSPRFGVDLGISDSCLAPQLGRILDELKPRTLIIERDPETAIMSYKKYALAAGLPFGELHCWRFVRAAKREIETVRSHPLVKCVKFHTLDDYATLAEAMEWILPGIDLPDLRTLMSFNIQVTAKHVIAVASKPHSGWHLEKCLA